MKYTAYIVLLSVLIQGCINKSNKPEFPNAGVITYNIAYPKEITDSPTGSLMPRELKLIFKDNRTRFSFKGSFNIFSLDFYSPSAKDSCATLFRFMDNNLLHIGPISSNFFFFNNGSTPSITYLKNETKNVAGISCSKAMVQFDKDEPFAIYYTGDINIDNPNRHTPFKEIPGILMEFHIDFNGVRFYFKACDVDYTIPDNAAFKIPSGFKRTPEKEIEALILTMINNFQ
ncbi:MULTISPECIES: hypothetical protein [unclassified Saccharicrinis]|uniref:hypothetical protein n=1 Tax=unclassified Saccharicrinis TaxID=2646859 RepID=UPI003D329FB6